MWFRLAAAEGAEAQFNLGLVYDPAIAQRGRDISTFLWIKHLAQCLAQRRRKSHQLGHKDMTNR